MATDPRKFTVSYCPTAASKAATTIDARRGHTRGLLGEVSGLSVVGDLGGDAVGEGLRDLVGLSDNVAESGFIPQEWQVSEDQGANQVLDGMGINPQQVATGGGGSLNLRDANAGYNSAKQVYNNVITGEFTLDKAKNLVNDFRGLKNTLAKVYTDPDAQKSFEKCFATPYAEALVYTMAPKQKFLFVVEFILNDGFDKFVDKAREMAFVVKQAERPNVNFEYEEVNMYNFKTKVLKKVDYQPVNIRFHDDGHNAGANLHALYLRTISPIANYANHDTIVEESGMNFTDPGHGGRYGSGSSASMSQLYNDKKTIFKEIRLFHIFKYGRFMNVYHFISPKIVSFELDDLDMATSDTSEISMQLTYDGLYIEPSVNMDPTSQFDYDITDYTKLGDSDKYAIKYSFSPSDTDPTGMHSINNEELLGPPGS